MNIKHNREDQQFETEVAGGTAVVTYSRNDGEITFHHTEVPRAAAGQGVGQALVKTALQYARDEKLRVVPECEYVAAFVKKHREYDDIVDPEYL